MDYDKVDKRIIQALKKEEVMNLNRLILKSFPREGIKAFKSRLGILKKNNIITIKGRPKNRNNGTGWTIKLKDKNRKV